MFDQPRRCSLPTALLYLLVITAIISFSVFYWYCTVMDNFRGKLFPPRAEFHRISGTHGMKAKDDVVRGEAVRRMQQLQPMKEIVNEKLLQNVSRNPATGRLFTVLSKNADLTPGNFNSILLKDESDAASNDKLFIASKHICKGRAPLLLIIVLSVVDNFEHRQAIRKTWMGAIQSNYWPGQDVTNAVRQLFFLGKPANLNRVQWQRVKRESRHYHDIVFSDVIDSYSNVSRKMISALKWVNKHCSTTKFILKSDEDTFVNIPLMLNVILHVAKEVKTKTFVMGRAHTSITPEVAREGQWVVSEKQYPFAIFPRYLYGHSYVISQASIAPLIAMSRKVNQVSQEDAYLTGILAKLANVTRIDVSCFPLCCVDSYDCEIVWNQVVSMATDNSPEDHYRLWHSVTRRLCHPRIAFNSKSQFQLQPRPELIQRRVL